MRLHCLQPHATGGAGRICDRDHPSGHAAAAGLCVHDGATPVVPTPSYKAGREGHRSQGCIQPGAGIHPPPPAGHGLGAPAARLRCRPAAPLQRRVARCAGDVRTLSASFVGGLEANKQSHAIHALALVIDAAALEFGPFLRPSLASCAAWILSCNVLDGTVHQSAGQACPPLRASVVAIPLS